MVDVVRSQVAERPGQMSYRFLADGEHETQSLSYQQLDQRARAIAALLQSERLSGKRVFLVYPPGLDFVEAFYGCLYAGAVAVPTYPPDPMRLARTLPRFLAIFRDARPGAVLTQAQILPFADTLAHEAPDLRALPWHATDTLAPDAAGSWQPPRLTESALAFLQYTSGSTNRPRGVKVSHGNLLHNQRMIKEAMRQGPENVGVSWLPFYHDMGLIGMVMHMLYVGGTSVIMPPVAFLKKPLRWLQAISRYRATGSASPNFGYSMCVRKVSAEERQTLDLSSWTIALNGAEPVRAQTMDRFARYFAPAGFRREAFYPSYGLAEATLFVTGGELGQPPVVQHVDTAALEGNRVVAVAPGDEDAHALVGCGHTWLEQKVVVVDPDSFVPCASNEIGEIWIAGRSVCEGYWDLDQETMKTFKAFLAGSGEGPFLRSGDLGFVREDGELFVTGRLVDLVIIRGRNHYPQDIERTAEQSHASIRPGCSAAFTVEEEGEELLVVAVEVERRHRDERRIHGERRRAARRSQGEVRRTGHDRRQEEVTDGADPTQPQPVDGDAVVASVRQAIAEEHGLNAAHILVLKAGAVPKTTSGKVQRYICRQAYLEATLEVFHEG